ncbi:uncharacterized protein PV06_07305 [Exophiala oligosperma]|uniref:Uncharacterized protein n=2 Tax=Exophiala oligosperma TaxID=215243 RepID=A0A0D2BWD6_9EURO|nr:uncharacterized protein PV06_07305 [Exophiala oligosperma]KIW41787.1 hypothetical protein PV06_07305 [Exophiala oligosperma]
MSFVRNAFLVAAVVSAANALPNPKRSESSDLQWGPCPARMNFTSAYSYDCATLTVPLDYSNSTDGRTLDLQLLRVNATNQPSKGAILMNPGGPGGVGTQFVAGTAAEVQTILDGEYDLIGFDPRGTGNTIPYACNDTSSSGSKKTKRQEFDIPEPTFPEDYDLLELDIDDMSMAQLVGVLQNELSDLQVVAETCAADNEEYGEYIGTAFVARDMLRIVDALGQGSLLNYWGISYGTVLGGTFAAMFPNRTGFMLLESNVNLHEYMSGAGIQARATLDANVDALFEQCMVYPEECALADDHQTVESLAQNYENLVAALDQQGIPMNDTDDEIDGGTVRNYMLSNLYNPSEWPEVAVALKVLYDGEWETFYNMSRPPKEGSYNKGTEALLGIRCGDSRLRSDNVTDLEGLIEIQLNVSRWFPLQPTLEGMTWVAWQQEAKERYNGDFQVKTQTPILVLNNAYDNITPLISARNTSSGFAESVLLVQNSYGHVPEYTPSLCTAQAIRNYFGNGTMPSNGTVCEQEVPNFLPQNWTEIYQDLNKTGSSDLTKRAYSKREVDLLHAVRSLGEKLHQFDRL